MYLKMGLVTISPLERDQMTPTVPVSTDNITFSDIVESIQDERLYILIPLGLFLIVIFLAIAVCLMATNRRRFISMCGKKRQRRRTMQAYNQHESPLKQHADDEDDSEEIDIEDNPAKSLLSGRLQINRRFENYSSTSQLNSSSELRT